jgi:hypothetical protein
LSRRGRVRVISRLFATWTCTKSRLQLRHWRLTMSVLDFHSDSSSDKQTETSHQFSKEVLTQRHAS